MWNFQRIICIWICCVSCMFGTTQLSSLVQAVPYEYFDDHEQSFYDLDTEQIQAKYDTRLLSQQMLQTEQQQQQQQQKHLENLKGFHKTNSGSEGLLHSNNLETRKYPDAGISKKTTKLKSNDGYNILNVGADVDDDDDDLQNNDDNDERNDWLQETATKSTAPTTETTSAITETFDELHLPRAASCFTNGQKYTHGQKVPRLDNCEVCLCMDGEIFCWWEKCDKKSTKASTTYEDYSTPFEESSTTRIQLNSKTTYKTTLKPMKKPKTNEDYKYDDDDSAEIFEMQQEFEGLKEQLMRKEHEQEQQQQQQRKIHNHNKQMVKKKIYQQQEEEKHNKKIKEQNKKKQEEQQQRQKQQQEQKQHKNTEQQQQQHHHAHNRNKNNNNNNNHDYSSSGSNSKILNFPENLPSVLYYDYKTEEHHQHQHQHREQHLKHQKQKQHEKELKHRQQQQQQLQLQQQQQEQQKQQHHINRHHEYGQDFNTYSSSSSSSSSNSNNNPINNAVLNKKLTGAGDESKLHDGFSGPSTTFKYFSNGNENIYNRDLPTDSDILPEPPTKKPKYSTSITDTTTTQTKTTGIPISQLYHLSTSLMPTAGGIGGGGTGGAAATTTEAITKSIATTTNIPSSMPTLPLEKQNFSPWDYNNVNRDKTNSNGNSNSNNNNNNKESTEDDIIDTDDQDDAFHRWLTSTEKNNKNNFTLNDSIIERDGLDGGAGGSVVGYDASNIDYNMDDRNYENFNLAREATKANAEMGIMPGKTTTTINAFDGTLEEGVQGIARIYADGNSQKPKYEQNFNDNIYNTYNNYNNPYQNSKMELSNSRSSSSSGSHIISSTSSNEDNGVASVVNIDIMLTASSGDSQQQQQQPQQTNIVQTTNQHRQQQQQEQQHQQDFEHEKQFAKEQIKFIQPPPVLISNTNDVDNNNNKKNSLYSIINDNTKSYIATSSISSSNNKTINHIVGDGLNIEIQNMGVNLSSSNNNYNNNNNTTNQNLSNSNDSFRFNHISTTNATSATTIAETSAATTPPLSTTLSPERQCNVMGTLYKIGDILPQDTGNCLQCICIDGSTSDDTPRVTCSPHNCPPLVLPDLFDATGY